MSAATDIHGTPKRVLMLASNPSVSPTTGWPIGFWWAELTHPYWEFVEAGYEVTLASPDGGTLQADSFSDPSDASGYSAGDLISRGFIASPTHAAARQGPRRLRPGRRQGRRRRLPRHLRAPRRHPAQR